MAFALIVAMTGQADLFYPSNLQPRRPAKAVFGYSCHPMKSSKARICADVRSKLFYHCNVLRARPPSTYWMNPSNHEVHMHSPP